MRSRRAYGFLWSPSGREPHLPRCCRWGWCTAGTPSHSRQMELVAACIYAKRIGRICSAWEIIKEYFLLTGLKLIKNADKHRGGGGPGSWSAGWCHRSFHSLRSCTCSGPSWSQEQGEERKKAPIGMLCWSSSSSSPKMSNGSNNNEEKPNSQKKKKTKQHFYVI